MKPRTILSLCFALIALSGYTQAKLIFTYDAAGNQTVRQYCPDGDCSQNASKATAELAADSEETLELTAPNFLIYPNPATSSITLSWDAQLDVQLEKAYLLDLTSRKREMSFQQNGQGATVDVRRLPSGVYLLRFELGDGSAITRKIIKH
ncbi:MAG: T9SS type A sorting domain-containing protein [Bacteroidota bacterium]